MPLVLVSREPGPGPVLLYPVLILYAVVMAALRAAHPTQAIDDTVSEYYLAREIATTMTGLTIAVPEQEWALLAHASPEQFAAWLLDLANHVDLRKLRKTTRGPKKRPTPQTRFEGKPHVSTAKLLAESRRAVGGVTP
jgi:hypothetical protein